MEKLKRFIQIFVKILRILPPIIAVAYLCIPTAIKCPVNPFASIVSLIVSILIIVIAGFIASIWAKWLKRANNNLLELRFASKTKIGLILSFIIGFGLIGFGTVELYNKAVPLIERYKYYSDNTATVIYETNAYTAFPKLLTLQNGSLWAVFYQGDSHVDTQNDGKLYQTFSHDRGKTWELPRVVADDANLDTRNPAIGQLQDGTLMLIYLLYDQKTRSAVENQWINSTNGGLTWNSPNTLAAAHFNPLSGDQADWLSPFGNIFQMNGKYVAAFYGGLKDGISLARNRVLLLEFDLLKQEWAYYATPVGDNQRGYNEADVEWIGDRWLCVSRTSENILYYATSQDGLIWTAATSTGFKVGHSPDIVVLGSENNLIQLFCGYRGDKGLLRGGRATFDPSTGIFNCEHAVLYAAEGEGGPHFGYISAVLLETGSTLNEYRVGFVNYDVVLCCDRDCPTTIGKILWQEWAWT
jgi:hypothetical protein